jgi:hypothetical protein
MGRVMRLAVVVPIRMVFMVLDARKRMSNAAFMGTR